MATVAAYIDGFNLYYGMKAKYGRRYLWLDLVELVKRLRPGDDVVAVLDIRRGWFKTRTIAPCRTCGDHWMCTCPRRYRSHEEKETDVALGVAMVEDAACRLADCTVLVSADSDMAPAVAALRRINPAHPVLVAMPPGNLQPHKRFTGVGHFSINETALRRSQLPVSVTDGSGTEYRRPAKWV